MPTPQPPVPPRTVLSAPRRRGPDGLPPAFWRVGFPVLVVVLGLLVPVLAWVGARIVLNSSDGRLARPEDDPSAPGYEAVVEPTPTLFALQVRDGEAVGAATLAQTGEDAGGVIVLSFDTVVQRDGQAQTIADAYRAGGLEGARAAAELAVGVQMTDAVEIDDERLADLLGPLGSLTIDNNDAVVADGQVLFPAGDLEVSAADMGAFLGTAATGTAEVNRLVRYEAFWRAWLEAVAGAGEGAIPGEGDSGPGFFVSSIAGGDWSVVQLPTTQLPIPGTDDLLLQPEPEAVAAVVAELIPFPVGAPPGSRLRVRLLDGTGELDRGIPAAEAVVAGGGEVAVIGNAESVDVPATQIVVSGEADDAQVARLRESLGVGEVVVGSSAGRSDVTVVLGRDALERFSGADESPDDGGGEGG